MDINWYPGHMAKSRREMVESLSMVDAVCEIVDARIPRSSRNPDFDNFLRDKARLLVLNRRDLADPDRTRRWSAYFRSLGFWVIAADSRTGAGCDAFLPAAREALAERLNRFKERGQVGRGLRIMVAGIPNVGKSSFINRVSGRKNMRAEDRPGVTRAKQWIRLGGGFELMDTPGMLWPKITDQETGMNLAFTGAIRDDILDIETLACGLLARLGRDFPHALAARYKVEPREGMTGLDLMEAVARARGFLVAGGEADYERCARVVLDEFRGGLLGRITLETPPDEKAAPETEADA